MAGGRKKASLIDPVYDRFVRGVVRAIGSTEFYTFFMDAIAHADNQFQFSNRKLEKIVDTSWVDAIEDALQAMQNVISKPRNIIKEEELIVNVANARKAGAETVRHLAMHSSLVEDFDADRGTVRPSKLMQRFREDSIGLYENRLVYTTMEYAFNFVKIRHDALFEAMSDEFGAKLKINSEMDSATEHVHLDMFLHIKDTDSALETDEKNEEVFARISRIYRVLGVYMNSSFAEQLGKEQRMKGKITKTNVLKKNKDYKKILKLWEFLKTYDDVGYTIRVIEQNPTINERFQEDIYHNILFNYLVLKGYLEDERDREIPTAAKGRKRNLKPKFIHEIVEELTEDYDLPDVEIRKVLIEELTKEQLMQEEAAERRRLVEEQAQRRKEEQARIKAEKEAEKQRLKAEREAEKERQRKEAEAEAARRRQEEMAQRLEDRRIAKLYNKELAFFAEHLEAQKAARAAEEAKKQAVTELDDYADAVRLLEEAEQRKLGEKERKQRRDQAEKFRQKQEDEEKSEAEREARLAERRRMIAEKAAAAEQKRQEQLAEEARLAAELRERDLVLLQPIIAELKAFTEEYPKQMAQRMMLTEEQRQLAEARRQAYANRTEHRG